MMINQDYVLCPGSPAAGPRPAAWESRPSPNPLADSPHDYWKPASRSPPLGACLHGRSVAALAAVLAYFDKVRPDLSDYSIQFRLPGVVNGPIRDLRDLQSAFSEWPHRADHAQLLSPGVTMLTQDHFTSEYDAAIVDQPGHGPDHAFVAEAAGARAITVAVEPWGEDAWAASFAAPDPGFHALTAVVGTPSPTGLCVVERGTAFLGDVRDPAGFSVVRTVGPVVAAEELTGEELLLLVTRWAITAVGANGVLWTSARIAIAGLRLDEAGDGWARGVADPDEAEPRDFAIDLSNGQVVGGAGFR